MVVQSYTVLVVDKADLVRRTTNRIVTKEGYRVLEAADAKEALMVLAMPQAHVDLVLVDAVLPGDDGVALCADISARWPHVPVVVTFDPNTFGTGRGTQRSSPRWRTEAVERLIVISYDANVALTSGEPEEDPLLCSIGV